MKLLLKLGKLDTGNKTAVADFGDDYDKLLTEVEYDLQKEEDKPPKE
jgi:hypothetical protein